MTKGANGNPVFRQTKYKTLAAPVATFSLGALTATRVAAAWTILQSERGLVLWLEGRRLWDLRRWFVEGTNTFLQVVTSVCRRVRMSRRQIRIFADTDSKRWTEALPFQQGILSAV